MRHNSILLANYSIYYQNVRGLNTKLNNVLIESSVLPHDFLALTETWLTPSIYSNELFDSWLYSVFRSDRRATRKRSRGGGVLIAAHQALNTTIFDTTSLSTFEDIDIIGVRLVENCNQLLLIVVYIPPTLVASVFSEFLDALSERLSEVGCKIIIAGDFNINKFLKHQAKLLFDARSAHLNDFNNLLKFEQYNLITNYQNN